MSSSQERSKRPNLLGIRAYLEKVYEHMEEVASGRRVMFGSGRLSTRELRGRVNTGLGSEEQSETSEEEQHDLRRGHV